MFGEEEGEEIIISCWITGERTGGETEDGTGVIPGAPSLAGPLPLGAGLAFCGLDKGGEGDETCLTVGEEERESILDSRDETEDWMEEKREEN
jgi:hypothetical protein